RSGLPAGATPCQNNRPTGAAATAPTSSVSASSSPRSPQSAAPQFPVDGAALELTQPPNRSANSFLLAASALIAAGTLIGISLTSARLGKPSGGCTSRRAGRYPIFAATSCPSLDRMKSTKASAAVGFLVDCIAATGSVTAETPSLGNTKL